MATSTDICSQARAWLGLTESDGSFRQLIDLYNSDYPIPRGYKAKYTSEWCAIFVTDVAIACHATDIIGKECSVPKFMQIFKNKGIWLGKNCTPKPGDIVIYDWDGNNDGDHIGIIVENVAGYTVKAVEGNFDEAVRMRQFDYRWSKVVGYARPKYDEACPVYRLYNPNNGEHFYTINLKEAETLISKGWSSEGILGYAVDHGDYPVYRLYNSKAGDHMFTRSITERNNLIKAGWHYEGTAFYSLADSKSPVYRLYNPNARTGTHHFTTSSTERDALVKYGWKYEGIGWYLK